MTSETAAESCYLEGGKPRLRNSIVGFLDLLGFSQQVVAAEDEATAQRLLDKISSSIADSRDYVIREMSEEFRVHPRGWSVKFFTDNLVLGSPLEDAPGALGSGAQFVLRSTQHYQLRMALSGLFLRGGLTHGPVCIADEIVFGRALIECYQLESKISIVPRVIITAPLQAALAESLVGTSPGAGSELRELICRDVDGWWFVNYLQAAVVAGRVDWSRIEQHRRSILDSLATTTRHDVLPKFGWACRYHNMFCHWHRQDPGYRDEYRVARDDDRSTILRLSEVLEAPAAHG